MEFVLYALQEQLPLLMVLAAQTVELTNNQLMVNAFATQALPSTQPKYALFVQAYLMDSS